MLETRTQEPVFGEVTDDLVSRSMAVGMEAGREIERKAQAERDSGSRGSLREPLRSDLSFVAGAIGLALAATVWIGGHYLGLEMRENPESYINVEQVYETPEKKEVPILYGIF